MRFCIPAPDAIKSAAAGAQTALPDFYPVLASLLKGHSMTNAQLSDRARTFVIILDRFILRLAQHWLLVFNLVFGLYAGLPLVAPLLMSWGQTRAANAIYIVYQFLCHQMPSRSFFVGRFQVGLCQRDLAIYGGACLAGLAFALVRDRVKPLPIRVWLILVAPLALDGVTQLLGLRTSIWQLRTMTGLLASGATIWMAYPYLEQAFNEAEQSARAQLTKARANSSEDAG
jgi:uncharacterized membrane protein